LTKLLARFAEDIFWLARYVERAENVARILDVNETFARNSQGEQEWLPVVELYSDAERFFKSHKRAAAAAVIDFYVLDRKNPSSIASAIYAARENARALRHLISTEMWQQLNVFHRELSQLNRRDVTLPKLSRVCSRIKESCQMHTGVTEGTLYRDEAWCFYQIGKYIERADQTSRLLDMRYMRMKNREAVSAGGTDVSEWNALLRSVAGYQAFRRTHPLNIGVEDVAAFLVFEDDFPRSIVCSVQLVEDMFAELEVQHGLVSGRKLKATLKGVHTMLHPRSTVKIRRDIKALHEFIDRVQLHLLGLGDEMGSTFFAHGT
jgi:uncharacterized alpha-E superfamily protein